MNLTDKFDQLSEELKVKSYLSNSIQTIINTAGKYDNTAVFLKKICPA